MGSEHELSSPFGAVQDNHAGNLCGRASVEDVVNQPPRQGSSAVERRIEKVLLALTFEDDFDSGDAYGFSDGERLALVRQKSPSGEPGAVGTAQIFDGKTALVARKTGVPARDSSKR